MLANPQVPDSQTTKIKTAKISETQISACFAKICTSENYQPYGRCSMLPATLALFPVLNLWVCPHTSKVSLPTLYLLTHLKIPGPPCQHNFNVCVPKCGSLETRLLIYRPYPRDHFALRHSLPDGKSARTSISCRVYGCKRRGLKGSSARFFRFSEAPNFMML